jgi:hypothetical protein
MPTKETVIRNEIVRVNGKVKAITIPKEKTQEILKRVELRLLDKKYEVLMPSVDNMDKNTIDLQGMATFIQQYLSLMFTGSGIISTSQIIQIVITTTTGSQIQLNYGSTVVNNAQGVTTAMQIFGQQNSMQVQYYFIGYDTTNSSYQGNYLELYSTSYVYNGDIYISNLVRIAYANLSINKQPNYDLFILWLVEFQNVPSYLIIFMPVIISPLGLIPITFVETSAGGPSSFNVYVNNGSCNFTCGGNCPSNRPGNFMISIQNNTIILQIPVLVPINNGVSSAEILICQSGKYYTETNGVSPGQTVTGSNFTLYNVYTFSSSYSTTIAPPSSGYIFFALLAVIAITFTVS